MAGGESSIWSREEDKAFENALAIYDVDSEDGWKNIASTVPQKSLEEVKHHYQLLVEDINMIESGIIPIPNYPDDSPSHHNHVQEEVQHDVDDSTSEEVEDSESDMSIEELQSESFVAAAVVDAVPKVESCDTTTIEQVYDEPLASDKVVLAPTSGEVEEYESDMSIEEVHSESLVAAVVADVPKVEYCDTTTIEQVYDEPLASDEVGLAPTSEEVAESESDMSSKEVHSESLVAAVVADVPKVESCDTTTEQVYDEPLASDEVVLAPTSEKVEESESDMSSEEVQSDSLVAAAVVASVPKVESCVTTIEQVYDEPLASDEAGLAQVEVAAVPKVVSYETSTEQVFDGPLPFDEAGLKLLLSRKLDLMRQQQLDKFTMNP